VIEVEAQVQGNTVVVTRLLESLARVMPRTAVRVEWHDRFSARLADTYMAVGGEEWVPLELLRRVLVTPGPHRKRVAVLYRDDRPWAVAPLRLGARFWEPLMQGVIPDLPAFPSAPDDDAVASALRVNLGVWASLQPSTAWKNVRWMSRLPCYEIDLAADPERHWRATELWKTIVQMKRRTADLQLVRDSIDGCTWMIERWRDRFYHGDDDAVSAKWNDRITVAKWALEHGWSMHSWHLRDGDRWVSGATTFERAGRVSLGTIFRDPEYDWYGAGHRCLYEAVMWSRAEGFRTMSFGNSFDYKRRWAQPLGTHWDAIIAPLPVFAWDAAVERARRALSRNDRG
jgi:hypothetical protein